MAVASERALVGTVVVGRYRVNARVAKGATGDVYEAEHVELGTHVALKVLHPQHADSEVAARFLREGKTLGLFRHRNIVELLEVGRLDDGALFLATELVRGVSLRTMLDVGNIAPRRALSIVRQLLEALSSAHATGVVHRDVRPENIMISTEHGEDLVKVLDFGVAKLFADTAAVLGESKLTKAGISALGDPRYMAPECVVGGNVDARADLYSTGAVLYELLTGQPPFVDPDPQALMRLHAYGPVPTLKQREPTRTFMPEMELLVSEALAKKPDVRYHSAAEMMTAVDGALASLANFVANAPVPDREEKPSHPEFADLARDFLAGSSTMPSTPPESASPAFTEQGAPPTFEHAISQTAPAFADRPDRAPLAKPPPSVSSAKRPAAPSAIDKAKANARNVLSLAKRHRRIGAALAGALVLVIILLAIFSGDSQPSAKGSHKKVDTDLVKRANELLAAGNAKQANELIEVEIAGVAKPDGDVLVALGHARFQLGRKLDALAAYERAVTVAPKVKSDDTVRTNVISIADGKDVAAAVVALDFLATRVEPPAHDQIVTAAASAKNADVRRRAFAIAEREGIVDRVDRVGAASLDLAQAQTCEDRRVMIAKLRATGDKRALPSLKRVKAYKCVEKDAADAIAELEGTP